MYVRTAADLLHFSLITSLQTRLQTMGPNASKPDAFVVAVARGSAGDDFRSNGAGQKIAASSVDGKESTSLYREDDNEFDAADTCCLAPLPNLGGTFASSGSDSASPQRTSSTQSKDKVARPHTPRRSALPKPKRLLWGCSNAEEHYQYIIDVCKRVETMHGADGLRELGLEYRMVHDPFNCQCEGIDLEDVADIGPGGTSSAAAATATATFDELDPRLWEEEEEKVDGKKNDSTASTSSSNNEEDYTEPLLLDEEEEYMVPIGKPLADGSAESTTTKACTALISHENLPQVALTKSRLEDMNKEEESATATTLTTSPSNTSLFSLATHHTWTSGEDREDAMELEHGCALRLVHVPPPALDACRPPTLIEADNYETFIANGRMYDEVARLCMEYAQDLMIDEGDLEWVPICDERSISALVSRGYCKQRGKRATLLIITGKGKVRSGIFSRRHIITAGVEASTALPMIREARSRNMVVVMLDPNANGDINGMDTIDASLGRLFGTTNIDSGEQDGSEEIENGVYIIAHSMAGAQIVRYLNGDKQVGAAANSNGGSEDGERVALLRQIKAVVFTDGNHNINWTKKTNPELTAMLQGPSALYVKSHKLHQDDPKELGSLHHDCEFWKHRFGSIRTIWAGTHEHALTNFTARNYIWDHFDSFLERGNNLEEDQEEKAPSF